MPATDLPLLAGEWVLTYVVHSSVLLGLLWVATRPGWIRSEPLLEALWKGALLGGILTASIQAGLAIEPLAGLIRLAPERAGVVIDHEDDILRGAAPSLPFFREPTSTGAHGEALDVFPSMTSSQVLEHPNSLERKFGDTSAYEHHWESGDRLADATDEESTVPFAISIGRGDPLGAGAAEGEPGLRRSQHSGGGAFWRAPADPIRLLVTLAGAVVLLLALVIHLRSWLGLRRLLRGRRPLVTGPLAAALERLRWSAGVRRRIRLTTSDHVTVPFAVGILRPEICLPARALEGLSPAKQAGMLAHELAHLERNDPLWLLIFSCVESVLFFQPLNRLARCCWQEIAEYRCDAQAAAHTGGRLEMARCLTEVAGWIAHRGVALRHVAVHGMARSRSSLSRRITRLLDESTLVPERAGGRWLLVTPLFLILPVLAFCPAVALLPEREPEAAPETQEMSLAGDRQSVPEPNSPSETELAGALRDLQREIRSLEEELSVLGDTLKRAGMGDTKIRDLLRRVASKLELLKLRQHRLSISLNTRSLPDSRGGSDRADRVNQRVAR